MTQVRHPAVGLDETVHQRVRVGILAILSETRGVTFTYLRDTLELTDGNLSKHISVLVDAGLVTMRKEFVQNRPRTWVTATDNGLHTFRGEMRSLRELVRRYGGRAAGS